MQDYLAGKWGPAVDALAWRAVAIRFGQVGLTDIGAGRGHPKLLAQMQLRTRKPSPEPASAELEGVVREALGRYNAAYAGFEQLVGGLSMVMASRTREVTTALFEAAESAQARRDELDEAVETLGRWATEQRELASVAKKRTTAKVGQAHKALEKGGCPALLARHIVTHRMMPRPEGVTDDADWPAALPASIPAMVDSPPAAEGELWWNSSRLFDLSGSPPEGVSHVESSV